MARKSLKNSKHLVELVNAAGLPALRMLAEAAPFEFLKPLDWEKPGPDFCQEAIETIAGLPRARIGQADQEAVRVLQLGDWRSEELLDFAAQSVIFRRSGHPDFDPSADVLTRLIWFLVRLPEVFDQIETIFLAHHYHGHKKFKPFKVRDGDHRPFVWSEAIGQTLQAKAGELLELDEAARGNCEVIHFEMEETGGDPAAAPKLLHYVVVYHPGKMKLLRQMKDRRRDILAFYPALEATLIYDPAENRIMVLADKLGTRLALAKCFSEIGFDKPLSAEPLEEVSYDLSAFQHPVDLLAPRLPGALIEQAWVASMTVSLGHTPHKLTLTMNHDADFWAVVDENFGANNPLTRARSIYEVRLCFVVRFDGQDQSKPLDLAVTHKTCSLWSLPDPKLRCCGEDILMALGLMKRVEPDFDDLDSQRFLAELELLDQPGEAIEGFRLREMNLDVTDLETRGAIRKRAMANFITRLIEEEDAEPVYQRLEVQSDSRRTWAVDPLTGEHLELSEGDLRGYTVNKNWLRERLTARLVPQLSGIPLEPEDKEPFFLGYYRFGDQDIPVSLATRLWQDKQADAMDVEIRKQALGVGVVLTTTRRRYRTFLGSSIVVPIAMLIEEGPGGVRLNLGRIEPEFRRWRAPAETADQPRLIKEAYGAILAGPWPEIWALSKTEQIASVEVLVKAWQSGKRKCSTEQVLAGYAGARTVPERFRGEPRWTLYIRGADGHKHSRHWELNIGPPDLAASASGP